jgi:predicted Zn-dependent peptidase
LAALTAETMLRTKIDGSTLLERVTRNGGSLSYTIDPDVVRFSVEALPDALPAIARDIAAVFAAPDTSGPIVNAAREAIVARIADDEKNPLVVGLTMLRTSYYSGAAGYPSLGSPATLMNLDGSDVAAYVAAHYRRGSAFATATGRVDGRVNEAARIALEALREGTEALPAITVRPPDAAGKQIVTHRDIGVPVMLVGFAAPALGERDFAAMLVVRALLAGIAQRTSTTTVGPFERGIAPIYDYDVKPATFSVALNGGRLDPTAALERMRSLLRATADRPLTATQLSNLRDAARGAWTLEAITLSDRAWQIGAAIATGSPPGTAADVGAAIAQVSADDVQRVARAYLQRYTVALVLPRSVAP